jgi:hypothetical protein
MAEPGLRGEKADVYHVFIASPSDVAGERESVRGYFADLNRGVARAWGVKFEVVDWENYSTIGIGRPQELIEDQVLERFRDSLVLVVAIFAQRLGTPTGGHRSATEEEIEWALAARARTGHPEVKFFFRDVRQFTAPSDLAHLSEAVEQWKRVQEFRGELAATQSAFIQSYPDAESFDAVVRHDLDLWVNAPDRPWAMARGDVPREPRDGERPPRAYYENLVSEYQWLDIAGIDSDRVFKLPLKEIYVRLRVIAGAGDNGDSSEDSTPISIQGALASNRQLVIVGDPGSGKSTFLRFIALTLAQCALSGDPLPAAAGLSLDEPLPVPLYLSCWDLAEHLTRRGQGRVTPDDLIALLRERTGETGWAVDLETALGRDDFIFLIDGLDEVPTEEGRQVVSNLIEKFVAQYPQHRYVVTSRVRAYTGETVLRQRFTRCDIQPFGPDERTAFLRNWVAQLLELRDLAHRDAPAAGAELVALSHAIETSSIRSLATNPLLLTVIAIVHWNRKRLPERRVDLYNQCIDVLLGQRKQAEQRRTSPDPRILQAEVARERRHEQAWVRKRFAEIAFALLDLRDEDIGRTAVIKLLEPHFSARAGEFAREEAGHFLDEQELRSGLLVNRHSRTYQFVHLTFQEYLAAWHLANRDLPETLEIVRGHLRDPKWFETLQLLGGELANRSDEYLDRYVAVILAEAGETIRERAPVIALCANIVRDTQAVAGLSRAAQSRYEALVRDTFDAFLPSSRVPDVIQLDLLEALRGVGAPAKEQLIAATRSRLLNVRRRALMILIPHLSDEDLFAMGHILGDRSKEVVKTYLNAIVERDPVRAARVVLQLSWHGSKTLDALLEASSPVLPADGLSAWPQLVRQFQEKSGWDTAVDVISRWRDDRAVTGTLMASLALEGNARPLKTLLFNGKHRAEGAKVIEQMDEEVLRGLAEQGSTLPMVHLGGPPEEAEAGWALVARLARCGDPHAISALLRYRSHDEATWRLIAHLPDSAIAILAAQRTDMLSPTFGNSAEQHPEMREMVERLARYGSAEAVVDLVAYWSDRVETWGLIAHLDDAAVRRLCESFYYSHPGVEILSLARYMDTRGRLRELIDVSARRQLLEMVQSRDHPAVWQLNVDLARQGDSPAIERLVVGWYELEETWELIEQLAQEGIGQAIVSLAWHRGDRERTWELIGQLDDAVIGRMAGHLPPRAIQGLVHAHQRRAGTWMLVERLARHGDQQSLACLIQHRSERYSTWVLVRSLDDEAIECLAEDGPWSVVGLTDRWGYHEALWALIERLARRGSFYAVRALVADRGNRAETWELIGQLDEQAVQQLAAAAYPRSMTSLVKRCGDRPELWRLIERLAEKGNEEALSALAGERGDQERSWSLITEQSERVSEARCLLAWRDWALATGGPEALRPTGRLAALAAEDSQPR